MSYKKIFLLGFIIVILIAIPLTIYVVQKRQSISTKADASTTLSFDPESSSVKVGETLALDIYLDPETGATGSNPNQVSFVKLSISFDSSAFTTVENSLEVNSESPNTLTTIIEEAQYETGKATLSLSIGADPTKIVTTKTKIATLQLKAVAQTSPAAANITFDPSPDTQVLSIASTDQTSENVLSTTLPATVTVTSTADGGDAITPTPTTTTATTTTTPTPANASTTENVPVCTGLNVDRSTTGTAPYSLTFTAIGNDSDGTISKASFNFGDGPIQIVTTGGGIGTNSVSVQTSHTYNNAGSYTAYVILTDNGSNLSIQQDSCTKTITVNPTQAGSGSGNSGSSGTVIQPLPTQIILPPTGPGEKIMGIGIIGVIFAIIGGTLLILL